MSRWSEEYWIQEAQGSDPDDPRNHWTTLRHLAFEDREDAEASVARLQAMRPVRYRWPLGHFRLDGVPAPARNTVNRGWWLRYWWAYARKWGPRAAPPPELESTTDFADLPEACLVPVRVVYRAVSERYLQARGDDWTAWASKQENKHGFFVRGYAPGQRMTDDEIAAHFTTCYPLKW